MANKIKLRNDTASQWTAENPVLLLGEVGLETDTRKLKVGDGTTAWSSRPYFNNDGVWKADSVSASVVDGDLTHDPSWQDSLILVEMGGSDADFYLPEAVDGARFALSLDNSTLNISGLVFYLSGLNAVSITSAEGLCVFTAIGGSWWLSPGVVSSGLAVADGAAGFMSGADKAKLDDLEEETAASLLEKLQGADPTALKIGGEYLPPVIPNVLLELDTVPVDSILPVNTLGVDPDGNPVIGDGLTEGGRQFGNQSITEIEGTVVLTDAQLDVANLVEIGQVTVSAANAVVGKKLRMRGTFQTYMTGAEIGNVRIGIRPAALSVPTSYALLSGVVKPSIDVGKPSLGFVDMVMEMTDSSGLLLFSLFAADNPVGHAVVTSSSTTVTTSLTGAIQSTNKISPAVSSLLKVYVGLAAGLTTTGAKISYNLRFTFE